MTKSILARSSTSAAAVALAMAARASESSGTEAVSEMPVTGAMIGMIVGGLAVMGIVIFVLVKFLNK